MSWKSVDLVTVCDFQGGTQPPKSEWSSKKKDGFIRMVQIRDFTQGKDSFVEYVKDNKKLKKCAQDDVLIGRYGASIGKILTGIEGAYNVALVKTIPSKDLDKRYFFHYLTSPYFQNFIQNAGSRAAQAGFNKEELSELKIPLPPLPIQKRIAEILDAADTLRRKDQELLKKYDELAQSIFIDMFGDPVKNEKGWEVRSLDKITTKLGDGIHGTPNYSIDGDYYFINGNNLENGTIMVNESTKKVDENEFLKHKRELNENTMLVSINGTIGKVAFYKGENIILGKSACYFNIDKTQVTPIYLYSLIKSNYFINYAGGNATGSTIKNVSLKTMREFPVTLPPLSKQMIYDERIALIWESIKIVSSNEEKLIFNSLINKAFKGELVA